jgi:yecA family protein
MTRYEAYINKDWPESGQAYVAVARLRDDGRVQLGALLLDCWCLGVRDAVFVDDYSEGEYRDALKTHLSDDLRQPIHPACAKKLVEGAVEYAQQFGFAPHRDYKKARRAFSGVEASACPETFTYGKDGKPLFVSGENDRPERIRRVLSMLEAHCGRDGYHYICRAEELDPLDEEAADADAFDSQVIRRALFDRLEGEPNDVPRFYEVSGLITAMQLCPQVIMPTKILEVLWGPKGRSWSSTEDMKLFLDLLMAYWNTISDVVMYSTTNSGKTEDQHPVDVWEKDFDDDRDLIAAKIEWAIGFMRATEIWRHAWGNALTRPDVAPDWAVIAWWAGFRKLGNREEIAAYMKNKPSRDLNHAVTALARALRTPKP